jgi:hypothetical protein
MNALSWLALLSYVLGFLLVLVFAVAYLKRSEFLPYHRIAVGRNWSEVDPRMQVLLLALIRVAGSAWLALVLAAIFFLYVVFARPASLWQLLAFQCYCLAAVVPPVVVAIHVRKQTAAPTPVTAASMVVVFCMLGFAFALYSGHYL